MASDAPSTTPAAARRDYAAWAAWLDAQARTPFGWGRGDLNCVTRAAGALLALTGVDRLGELAWEDQRGALELLSSRGGMVEAVSGLLKPVTPARAMRGDIGGVASPLSGTLLVSVHGQELSGIGPDGTVWLPRRALTHAWSAD